MAVWRGARPLGRVGRGRRVDLGHRDPPADRLAAPPARARPAARATHDRSSRRPRKPVLLGVEHGDLAGALNRLSPELRAVVQATVLDGLTTKEAGRLLGIPAGTVKTRMMRRASPAAGGTRMSTHVDARAARALRPRGRSTRPRLVLGRGAPAGLRASAGRRSRDLVDARPPATRTWDAIDDAHRRAPHDARRAAARPRSASREPTRAAARRHAGAAPRPGWPAIAAVLALAVAVAARARRARA